MTALDGLPRAYRAHLRAVTGPTPATVRDVWEPDGVLVFPYAPDRRLEGVDAIVGYFDGLRTFGGWSWRDVRCARVESEADEFVAELHGSSTILATGAPYEQDYVVRFGLAPSGRLAWMREYWDPTRF